MIRQAYEGSKPRWNRNRRRDRSPDRGEGGARRIECARCGHHIADTGDRTERFGLHEHSQINPHGYIWHFGCWARAPGCAETSAPTTEFTWFAGYRWQIASCGGCALHLGWLFSDGADRFWGLITDRLVERGDD